MRFGALATLVLVVLLAASAGGELVLTWQDNSGNESSFRIEHGLAGLAWQEIAVVGVNVAYYVDPLVLPGTLYTYRVRAFNSAGSSTYSNIASATILPPPTADEPPIIGAIADRTLLVGTSTPVIAFSIADAETAAGALTVTAQSSNSVLVPVDGLHLGGAGQDRTIIVTPEAERSGVATITVTVSE